jgi:hypothetical protein
MITVPNLHEAAVKYSRTGCCQAPVAHARNPSYSGGRDEEDLSSRPAWANSSQDPILNKILHEKRAGGVAQGAGSEFKPHYIKKKK